MAKMSTFPLRANVIHMLSNCDLRRGCCGKNVPVDFSFKWHYCWWLFFVLCFYHCAPVSPVHGCFPYTLSNLNETEQYSQKVI